MTAAGPEARLRALLDDAVAPLDPAGPAPGALAGTARRRRRSRTALAGGTAGLLLLGSATALGLGGGAPQDSAEVAAPPGPSAAPPSGARVVYPVRDPGWVAEWERSGDREAAWEDPVSAVQAFARDWLGLEEPLVSPAAVAGRYELALPVGGTPRVVTTVYVDDSGSDPAPGPYLVTAVDSSGLELEAPLAGTLVPGARDRRVIEVRGTAAAPAVTLDAVLHDEVGEGGSGDLPLGPGGRFEAPLQVGDRAGAQSVLVVARDAEGVVTAAEAVPVDVEPPLRTGAPAPAPVAERTLAVLRDGRAELHLADPEAPAGGARLVRVLVGPEGALAVTAVATDSGVGSVLVGRTDRDTCRSRLWSVQRDGTALTPLTPERPGRLEAVSVAGFGALTVIRPCDGGAPATLTVVDLEFGGEMPVALGRGEDVRQAAYAPDGDLAVVLVGGDLVVLVPDGRGGTERRTVPPRDGCSLSSPAWGHEALYAAERCGGRTTLVSFDAEDLAPRGGGVELAGDRSRTVGGLAEAHGGELLVVVEDAAGPTVVEAVGPYGDDRRPVARTVLTGAGCRAADDDCLASADW